MANNNDKQPPLVSVVIPAYNSVEFIRETIDSCLTQTYSNLEVVVVNDGSTDGTTAVLESYGPRIRLLNKPNGGLASARNAAHRMASGEYIAWLDGDDIALPERIAMQAAVLDRHPEVVLVSSDFSAFVTGGPVFERSHIGTYYSSFQSRGRAPSLFASSHTLEPPSARTFPSCKYWIGHQFENLLWGNFVHPPTLMARRAAIEAAGSLDEALVSGTDYEFILRLSRQGAFAFIDAPLLRYRRGDQQLSESFVHGETWTEYRRILEKYRRLEPEVFERHHARYVKAIARSYIYEAGAIGRKDRAKALRLLAASTHHKLMPAETLEALKYVLPPELLVRLVRKYRRWSKQRKRTEIGLQARS